MATIRVDDDLNVALKDQAKQKGISATQLANNLMRVGLGLAPSEPAQRAASPTPRPKRVKPESTPRSDCMHPSNRRLGNFCAECKTVVGGKSD